MKQNLITERGRFRSICHKLYLNQLRLKIRFSGAIHVNELLWILKKAAINK